jgi:hypothetical protein
MGAPTGQLQTVVTKSIRTPAEATANVGGVYSICRAPFTGALTRAVYYPDTVVTGVATNNKKIAIENRGPAGSGSVEAAALTFASGVNGPANDDNALTLSVTLTNRDFAEGDIIAARTVVNGTGLVLPAGTIEVDLTRD